MATWVYRHNARRQRDGYFEHGDWMYFFDEVRASDGVVAWGSTADLGREAHKLGREHFRVGDRFLCWQSDRRAALGVVELADLVPDGDDAHTVWLAPIDVFDEPAKLRDIAKEGHEELAAVDFIANPRQSTFQAISPSEWRTVMQACKSRTGGSRSASARPSAGAGFGGAELNRKVEQAAMKVVADDLRTRGFSVDASPADRRGLGYDILATKGSTELHVEVKGIQSEGLAFALTEKEYQVSRSDSQWQLAVVRRALESPTLTWHEPAELATWTTTPVSYRVTGRL